MAKLQKAVVGTFQIWTHKETVNLIPRGFVVFPPPVPTHWATVMLQQNCRKSWGFLVLINWIKNTYYFFSVCVIGFSNILITISATVKSDHGSAISDLYTYYSLNFLEVLLCMMFLAVLHSPNHCLHKSTWVEPCWALIKCVKLRNHHIRLIVF